MPRMYIKERFTAKLHKQEAISPPRSGVNLKERKAVAKNPATNTLAHLATTLNANSLTGRPTLPRKKNILQIVVTTASASRIMRMA